MTTRKIVVPVDFSTTGKAAVETAAALARDRGALLVIVHVEEPPLAYGGGELYYGIEEPDTQQLGQMLADVKPDDPKVACEHRLIVGNPAAAIVHLAQEEQAELIVMPTHGRTGLARLLMGSVAEEVVRKATCPVLTIKPAAMARK